MLSVKHQGNSFTKNYSHFQMTSGKNVEVAILLQQK